ncbi:MAG: protein BatD [Planctomycetes bacterium]|nr:protein BatD [Planctomycetota bacterium]
MWRYGKSWWVILILLWAIGLRGRLLHGQDVRLRVAVQEPPYYVGEPAVIQFTVDGFEEGPEPSVAIDNGSGELPSGLRANIAAINPSVVSQVIQRNGQIFQSRRVTYQIQYVVTADEPGEYQVGPFLLSQGTLEGRAKAVSLRFGTVPIDPRMRIRLTLPERPIYPDQRVPVGVEWWFDGEVENILKLAIYSPLFDQFHFAPDPPADRRSSQLPIDTKAGRLALAASVRQEQDDDQRFVVLSARRTLIPDKPGEYLLGPIRATARRATEWARPRSPFDDIDDRGFGGSLLRGFLDERRRPSRTELGRVEGEPLRVTVKPFPQEGRPASFAGAVGSGFSVDVAADRTVVRVGDPIGLRVSLRGDGNLENAGLPNLTADGGMDPQRFRLPDGEPPGAFADDTKTFQISVRVTDEAVDEIPALSFSWFDPLTESYQTAHSKPIALRVMPARVVSASDVVRSSAAASTPHDESSDQRSASGSQVAKADSASDRSALFLFGAELSVESDPGIVLGSTDGWHESIVSRLPLTLYFLGAVAVAIAVWDRRRTSVDPRITHQRRVLCEQRARIERARGLDARAAAREVSAALRLVLAESSDLDRDAASELIARCESIEYAPQSNGDRPFDEALLTSALRITNGGPK